MTSPSEPSPLGEALARIAVDAELRARMQEDPKAVLTELGVHDELERRVSEDPVGFLNALHGTDTMDDAALEGIVGGSLHAQMDQVYNVLRIGYQGGSVDLNPTFAPPYLPVFPV